MHETGKHIIAIIVNFIFKIFKLTYSKVNLEVLVYDSMVLTYMNSSH